MSTFLDPTRHAPPPVDDARPANLRKDGLRMDELRLIVLSEDPGVTELTADLLRQTQSHLFEQRDAFKYGLSFTHEGHVFHSPLFAHHPELLDLAASVAPGVRSEDDTLVFPFDAVDADRLERALRAVVHASSLKSFPLP